MEMVCSWDSLPEDVFVSIAGQGRRELGLLPQASTLRLVCRAWQQAIDANLHAIQLRRWPGQNSRELRLISRVSLLDLCRLGPAGATQPATLPTACDAGSLDMPGTAGCADLEASGSYSSIRRCSSSYGSQLDLMGAAVLAGAAASLMCYVASMWPEAVPHVTPAACLRLWRILPQLRQLQHLRLSGSMLLIKGVHSAVDGCPDAASGLSLLQRLHAVEVASSCGSSSVPVITHTYTLQVPPALCSLTGLKSLAIEWHLQADDDQQQQQQAPGSGSAPKFVRRRSYEGSCCNPTTNHIADPTISLPEQFSCLVGLQQLELAGSVADASVLLPMRGLQKLERLMLGPGRLAVQALVPLAGSGVLGGLTQLVLKQQGSWDVASTAAVLGAATRLQELDVVELEMSSDDLASAGPLRQFLTAADVSPLSSSLTSLSWSTCGQRLSGGASLLSRSTAAAVLPADHPGDTSAAAAGPWLGGLSALQSLQLTGMLHPSRSLLGAVGLDSLSCSIGSCSRLEHLGIKHLGLPLLPEVLSGLQHLRSVNVEAGAITRRHAQGPQAALAVLGRCSGLQQLTLGGCELRHVPAWLAGLQGVTGLNLHSNYLQELAEDLPCMGLPPALQCLDLTDNRLREVPDSIVQLSSLSRLALDSNYLTALPATIWDLPQLAELSVKENMLSELPECGCGPTADACHSNRRAVGAAAAVVAAAPVQPVGPGTAQELVEAAGLGLSAEEEELLSSIGVLERSCESAAAAHTAAARVSSAKQKQQRGKEEQLQRRCCCAGSLRSLVLSDNQLAELPHSLSQLSRLQQLDLNKNQLRCLPDKAGMWGLTSLTSLQLADNHLRKLPGGLAKLQYLVELDVSGNHLAVNMPAEAAALTVANTAPPDLPDGALPNAAFADDPCQHPMQADSSGANATGSAIASKSTRSSNRSSRATGQATSHTAAAASGQHCAVTSEPALARGHVTVIVDCPAAATAGAASAACWRSSCIKKQLQVLPCPLGSMPLLQEVRLGRQQVEGNSTWCSGQSSLQLLLDGLYELGEALRARLTPQCHKCCVAKAAAAAVAHIAGVASTKKAKAAAEQHLLAGEKLGARWPGSPAFSAQAMPSVV